MIIDMIIHNGLSGLYDYS